MRHKVRHVHFVGIGGSGMSGIAEVLANLGYSVSGSDLAESATTRRLQKVGIRVDIGHTADNAAGADALLISSSARHGLRELLERAEAILWREGRVAPPSGEPFESRVPPRAG